MSYKKGLLYDDPMDSSPGRNDTMSSDKNDLSSSFDISSLDLDVYLASFQRFLPKLQYLCPIKGRFGIIESD